MKNNNSHKQPGLRLPLLPAPPGCGGPVPRGALPPDGVRRPRKGLQAKGIFLCPGRALGSPIPGGDATAQRRPPGPWEGRAGCSHLPKLGESTGDGNRRERNGAPGLGSTILPRELPDRQTWGCQRRPERSRRCEVGELPPSRRGPGPRGTRLPLQPPVRPPVAPAASAGPWGRRGGGEGRPRSLSSFLGPSSPLHLREEKNPTCDETVLV